MTNELRDINQTMMSQELKLVLRMQKHFEQLTASLNNPPGDASDSRLESDQTTRSSPLKKHAPDIETNITALNQAAKEALKGMLYARTKTELATYQARIDNLLDKINTQLSVNNKDVEILQTAIKSFADSRNMYLDEAPTFLQFWRDETGFGLNFVFLILPLVIGMLIPPVGIAMLIFTMILTAFDLYDFGLKTSDYWDDTPIIGSREISAQQKNELLNDYFQEDIEYFMPVNQVKPEPKVSRFMYSIHTVIFAISILGLLALFVSSLAIPQVALLVLTLFAVTLSFYQLFSAYSKKDIEIKQLINLSQLTNEAIRDEDNQHIEQIASHPHQHILEYNSEETKQPSVRSVKFNPLLDDPNFFLDEWFAKHIDHSKTEKTEKKTDENTDENTDADETKHDNSRW